MEEPLSEEASTPDSSTEPVADVQSDSAELGDGGKKALDAERRRANTAEREAKALKARLDEIETAQLSEAEKAKKRAEEFEARALAAESGALRWRIAAKYGISDDDAELFLTGGDEDTLTRQAERFAERTTAQSKSDGLYVPAEGKVPSAPALNSNDLEVALRNKLNIR
jgi:hypothetical protein